MKAVFKASNSIFQKDVDYDRRGFQRNEVVYLNPYNTWPCKIPSQSGFEFLFWTETLNADKKQHVPILWPTTLRLTVIQAMSLRPNSFGPSYFLGQFWPKGFFGLKKMIGQVIRMAKRYLTLFSALTNKISSQKAEVLISEKLHRAKRDL